MERGGEGRAKKEVEQSGGWRGWEGGEERNTGDGTKRREVEEER